MGDPSVLSVTPCDKDPYVINDRLHSDPDPIRVICVGAGASGLCLAYKMKLHMTNYELVCYEKLVSSKVTIAMELTNMETAATETTQLAGKTSQTLFVTYY